MKKSVVWVISVVMSVSFMLLLFLQIKYMREMTAMSRRQFDEAVKHSLYEVAHKLELEETRQYLEQEINEREREESFPQGIFDGFMRQFFMFPGFSFDSPMPGFDLGPGLPSMRIPSDDQDDSPSTDNTQTLQEEQIKKYVTQKSLVDEVIYNILNTASNRPLNQRIDRNALSNVLTNELKDNGVDIPFHFVVTTTRGRTIFSCGCQDFNIKELKNTYSQTVFRNDSPSRMGIIRVYFPTLDDYIANSVNFVLPSIIFLVILMLSFVTTLYIVVRQKKLSEIKNDFINNMTHEFKTPISTISLAAQMLNDQAVAKSPQMFKHISGVITDETKRLRFQVEKVLQMSMFENQTNNMKLKEVNVDELIYGVVNTFKLKVENYGGTIDAQFESEDPFVMADEMHFTNVIFNIMDNAVKYRREDVPLTLTVKTWNEPGKMLISIKDNGIGIKKDDLKKVFEKFYRVHTGNRHDVKGFGLGLAYVKKVILDHKGTIVAESELGSGTEFIITLPHNYD